MQALCVVHTSVLILTLRKVSELSFLRTKGLEHPEHPPLGKKSSSNYGSSREWNTEWLLKTMQMNLI
jgi:hypothetical protein